MIKPVNWQLISHPINWVTFVLMVIIAGAIGHLFLSYLGVEPKLRSEYDDMPAGQTPGEATTNAIIPQSAN